MRYYYLGCVKLRGFAKAWISWFVYKRSSTNVSDRKLVLRLIISCSIFYWFFNFNLKIRFVNRRCTNSTTIKGIDIPEDTVIAVDVLSMHYNPEYWGEVDPNVFYPSRFKIDSNRYKLAYMPFGLGSRTCIGIDTWYN